MATALNTDEASQSGFVSPIMIAVIILLLPFGFVAALAELVRQTWEYRGAAVNTQGSRAFGLITSLIVLALLFALQFCVYATGYFWAARQPINRGN